MDKSSGLDKAPADPSARRTPWSGGGGGGSKVRNTKIICGFVWAGLHCSDRRPYTKKFRITLVHNNKGTPIIETRGGWGASDRLPTPLEKREISQCFYFSSPCTVMRRREMTVSRHTFGGVQTQICDAI
jgi:hypothetical protein